MVTNLKCSYCGNTFSGELRSIDKKDKNHFCNRNCYSNWQKIRIDLKCAYCGNSFSRKPGSVDKKAKNHYCNRNCYLNWQKIRIDFKCAYCGNDFNRKISGIGKGNKNHYCSKDCFLNAKRKKVNVTCCVCGKVYMPADRTSSYSIKNYCRSCRGTVKIICCICGTEFKQGKSRVRKRKNLCCSVKCKSILQRKSWNELSRGMLKQRWVKEFGKENFRCNRCGHDKDYNMILHHIKYVMHGGDNMPDNLEPLCLNCHGTEHYEKGNDEKE